MLDVLASLAVLAQSTAEEGKRVIYGMLITGLLFAGIVIVGETVHYYRHLKRH